MFSKRNQIRILFIALLSTANASRLRGLLRNENADDTHDGDRIPSLSTPSHRRRDIESSSSYFDCNLYDMDPIAPRGITVEGMWSCESIPTATRPFSKQYSFLGDIEAIVEQRFQGDVERIRSARMTVPHDAVVNATMIDVGHPDIHIRHDQERQRRSLAAKSGTQQLLIVRAIDGFGNAPAHWKQDLRDDFYQDGNNLKTRMKACSNNQLNIVPASGDDVTHGVLNVRFPDVNFKDFNWRDVGDMITSRLYSVPNLSYVTRIFLMPDIVDFNDAAAWAQVGGNTIWLKDAYASFPIVQVHEYGHLLGQGHSGADGNTYSDDTCYMGNEIPWTDHGAFMCFNPAKTWYFGWYSDHHEEVNPASAAFNADIAGIDDVVNQKAGSTKVIIRIMGDYNTFFLMYNRAKGINSEAIGGADEVVITQQNSGTQNSNFEKSLSDGGEWVYNNFGSTGKNLVVKNCYTEQNTSNGDIARVLIYVQGLNDQQCPGSESDESDNNDVIGNESNFYVNGDISCQDKDWVDNYGDSCSWFETNNRCDILGGVEGTNGWTASEACCACGGGDQNDNEGDNNSEESCVNDDTWYDEGGENYDCDWYERTTDACDLFGHQFMNFGKTANTACCLCKQ